jgi:hypothetical protein
MLTLLIHTPTITNTTNTNTNTNITNAIASAHAASTTDKTTPISPVTLNSRTADCWLAPTAVAVWNFVLEEVGYPLHGHHEIASAHFGGALLHLLLPDDTP